MCQKPNHWLKVLVSAGEEEEPFYKDEVQFGSGDMPTLSIAITHVLEKAKIHERQRVVVELHPYCRACNNSAGAGARGVLLCNQIPQGREGDVVAEFVRGLLITMQEANRIQMLARTLADEIALTLRGVYASNSRTVH